MREIWSFLGLCNIFRCFVPNFSRIASQISRRHRKTQTKEFLPLTKEETVALEKIKKKVFLAGTEYSKKQRTVLFDTNAFDRNFGCIILHEQHNGTTKPLGYCSCTLTDQENSLDTARIKCLSRLGSVFYTHLERYLFIGSTDHHALLWIPHPVDVTGKLAGFWLRLLEYGFEIVHRASVQFQVADALSTTPTTEIVRTELKNEIPVMVVAWRKLQNDKKNSTVTNRTLKKKIIIRISEESEMWLPTLSESITVQCKEGFWEQSHRLVGAPGSAFIFEKNEVTIWKFSINWSIQKPVPASLRAWLLHQAHHSILAGYLTERKIYDSLPEDYYWSQMVRRVYNIGNNYSQCPYTDTRFKY